MKDKLYRGPWDVLVAFPGGASFRRRAIVDEVGRSQYLLTISPEPESRARDETGKQLVVNREWCVLATPGLLKPQAAAPQSDAAPKVSDDAAPKEG